MPTASDQIEHGAKEAGKEAAVAEQQIEVLFNIGLSAPDAHETAKHRLENDQIDDRNSEQEQRRHQRANHSANLPGRINAMLQRERRGRDRNGAHDDDGGMAEREHQSHGDWPLPLLHQFPRHVVDRGNMIRIDRVAKSKAVSKKCSAQGAPETGEKRRTPSTTPPD